MDIFSRDKQYIANTYKRFPLAIESGKGSVLSGTDSKEYIDLSSGIAVNIFGACDEVWQQAVAQQTQRIAHASNLYYTQPQVELAELLCKKTGMKKVFFGNSGAEANECAIKTARKYSFDKYGEGRSKIVTLRNGFHGRTIATLSATGQDAMHKYFDPFLEGFDYAHPNDIDDTLSRMTDDCAGVGSGVGMGVGAGSCAGDAVGAGVGLPPNALIGSMNMTYAKRRPTSTIAASTVTRAIFNMVFTREAGFFTFLFSIATVYHTCGISGMEKKSRWEKKGAPARLSQGA